MTTIDFTIAFLGAILAGLVNAIAGGGTLITFPLLTFIGIPPVIANVSNTIALSPGYLSGFLTQIKQIKGNKKELWLLILASIIGGLVGGFLLLKTGESSFKTLIPYLILFAASLLAIQNPLRKWLNIQNETKKQNKASIYIFVSIGLSAVYGGYFGAGVSVIILAVLGILINRSLTELNGFKQVIAFSINASASVFFIFSATINWSLVLVMAIGAILGGGLGGKLALKLKSEWLRWTVVTVSFIIAMIYFFKS